jgi:catechol 2,3-dioxygenase
MEFTTLNSKVFLHHIGIESKNPEKIARFYSKTMKMNIISSKKNAWHCLGPNRLLIFLEGESQKLSFAAFACFEEHDLNQIKKRVLKEGLNLKSFDSLYLKKGAFSLLDPDGTVIVFGIPLQVERVNSSFHAPLQHLTLQSTDLLRFIDFYQVKLGFSISDRVINKEGIITTCFMRSNSEHHSLACFKSDKAVMDHHSYEVGDWNLIKDWCDHFSTLGIKLFWGPGRHGPGNNLFVFIQDCDGNKIELSAELEIVSSRQPIDWPHEARTLNLWGDALMRS